VHPAPETGLELVHGGSCAETRPPDIRVLSVSAATVRANMSALLIGQVYEVVFGYCTFR
jgi:hypothetical protein